MKKCVYIIVAFFLVLGSFRSNASDSTGVELHFAKERITDSNVLVTIKAIIPSSAKLYALQEANNNTLYSTVSVDSTVHQYLNGAIAEKGSMHSEKDPSVEAAVNYFTDSVLWQQKLNVLPSDSFQLKGTINYLYKKGEEYLPGEKEFKINIVPEKIETVSTTSSTYSNRSLFWIFLTAFGGGLLALLTPCVYSMIPVTVSFFTKRSKSKREGIKNALYYSASIIIMLFPPAPLHASHQYSPLLGLINSKVCCEDQS